jgi:hypothetical protein
VTPRPRRRGSILLLSIFFLFTLFFLAMALLQLLPVELNAARWARMNQEASYAADAGVTDTMTWLEDVLAGKLESLEYLNHDRNRSGSFGDWNWTVEVKPDDDSKPPTSNPVHVFRLTAVASLDGRPYRKIVTDVGQDSFAKYSVFCGDAPTGLWWGLEDTTIEGPMHVNGILSLRYGSDFFNSGKPAFHSTITASKFYTPAGKPANFGDGVDYGTTSNLPYNSNGDPIPERYNKLFTGGREALNTGVAEKVMPANTRDLAHEAWGADGSPVDPGVHVNSTATGTPLGGIYINGDVDQMVLSVDSSNPVTTITQGDRKTVVTSLTDAPLTIPQGSIVDGAATPVDQVVDVKNTVIQTQVGADGAKSYSVKTGLTNGLVYCSGTIHGLQGENKGRRTVAVDIEHDKEIVINGDVTQFGTTPGEPPRGAEHSLGLLGTNIRLSNTIPRTLNDPLYLYCSLFAGRKDPTAGYVGGLEVDGQEQGTGLGKFILYGSLIQSQDQAWNTTYSYRGVFLGKAGFDFELHYDPATSKFPPPYFPTMPNLSVLSWWEGPY